MRFTPVIINEKHLPLIPIESVDRERSSKDEMLLSHSL